jgi:hypothetical protein
VQLDQASREPSFLRPFRSERQFGDAAVECLFSGNASNVVAAKMGRRRNGTFLASSSQNRTVCLRPTGGNKVFRPMVTEWLVELTGLVVPSSTCWP